MIERVVLVKLETESATDSHRQALVAHSQALLVSLPGLRSLSLGLPADDHARRSWDLSVVMCFDDQATVDRALEAPAHVDWLTGVWAERIAVVKNWSFQRWGELSLLAGAT